MTHHKRTRKPLVKVRSLYLWHRYMGLSAALLVIILAVTGIFLNHTERLKLDEKFIESPWLLNWYDIEPPQRLISYLAKNNTVSLIEDQLYLNKQFMSGHYDSLAGAIHFQNMIVVAIDRQLLLFTVEGELIERLIDINGQSLTLGAIGKIGDELLVIQADQVLISNADLNLWQPPSKQQLENIEWSYPSGLTSEVQQQLIHSYRSNILTLERIMLDLHSGRIIGNYGVYLMDAAAVILLLLSFSGIWIWLQQRFKQNGRRRQNNNKRPSS